MLDPFQLLFVQRALLEVALLSIAAGLIGTWIVMRGLAFYSHAVAAATFPGLVVADGLGFAPALGALARRCCLRSPWVSWPGRAAVATTASPDSS